MTLQYVTVTWDEQDIGAAPLGGWVAFQLTSDLQDQADGTDVRRNPARTFYFNGPSGESDPLVANDSTGIVPAGTAYLVTVGIRGQQPVSFTSQLNIANGAEQALAFLQANAALPAAQYAQAMPLPSGTAEAGDLPEATGNGSASAWTKPIIKALRPSGDPTGATDTTAINTALAGMRPVVLADGAWNITDVGFIANSRKLRGSGPPTVVSVLPSASGFTFSGPGGVELSDLSIQMGAGAWGFTVNGLYDSHVHDIWVGGASAAGAVRINGDLATEQHWTDIVIRDAGGVNWDLERTTSAFTGSLYMDRVRIVTPPAGARGLRFNSTAAQPSLNTVFMTQCVADDFKQDACLMHNVAQVFVAQCWFAIGADAAPGSAPLHLSGTSLQHTYEGCYTYSGLASGADVLVEGTVAGVNIGGGHVFDGSSGNTALSTAGASGAVTVGTYLNYCGRFSDVATPPGLVDLVSNQAVAGDKTFTNNVTIQHDGAALLIKSPGTAQFDGPAFSAYNTASSMGSQGGLTLQAGIANTGATQGYVQFAQVDHTGAFVKVLAQWDLNAGTMTVQEPLTVQGAVAANGPVQPGNGSAPAAKLYSGSGAPVISGNFGDFYFRTDTGNANQRIYFCDGGTSWAGIA